MKKYKKYEVTRYSKHAVFDCKGNLVWRWFKDEKVCFSDRQKALRYFIACNYFNGEKAVLRIKKSKKLFTFTQFMEEV